MQCFRKTHNYTMYMYNHAKTFLLQKRQGPELQATETIRVVEKGGYPRAQT